MVPRRSVRACAHYKYKLRTLVDSIRHPVLMDSDQLKSLMGKDPYLKQYKCTIIAENELPEILHPNEGYFVLLPGIRKGVGHWVLIESFEALYGF